MLKNSLWNTSDQSDLKYRLSKLNKDSKRQWGTMNVGQMLRHMDIAYKNAIGEIFVPKQSMAVIASIPPVRWLFIYMLPFQKNLPTAKEYIASPNIDFGAAYDTFLNTYEKITKDLETIKFVEHPIFGKLSHQDWGALLYKHLDHHLKQFGV